MRDIFSSRGARGLARNVYLRCSEKLRTNNWREPETGLTHAKTKVQKQKERTEIARRFKNGVEEQWSKVDCDTMLGTRQSFKQRDLQRKSLYFESHEEAKIRTAKRKALEEAGLRKVKRHSPDSSSLDVGKAGLLQEVNAMKEGEKVSIN